MTRMFAIAAITAAFLCGPAFSQSLSPEDIKNLIDEKANNLNPYEELLNDPDPLRSLSAMQIMLESGDPDLTRMALEYGLLSNNANVRQQAFESFLKTGPLLAIRFDGTKLKDKSFPRIITSYFEGTYSDGVGYARIAVGEYDSESKCFREEDQNRCFFTINSDGIFVRPNYLNARAQLTDTGRLEGAGEMYGVDELVPFSIQLIE